MGDFLDIPEIDLRMLKPRGFQFRTPGGAQESPRNGLGQSRIFDIYGGPQIVGQYSDCAVGSPIEHEYHNWVDAHCSGSVRNVVVPILSSRYAGVFPFVGNRQITHIGGIPFSDGTLFSDGTGFSEPTMWGEVTESADLNAGRIKIEITGSARSLVYSMWFAIRHPAKGRHRVSIL